MVTPLNVRAELQADANFRQLVATLSQTNALMRFNQKQLWTIEDLEERYQMGRVELKGKMKALGVWPADNNDVRTARVPVEDVAWLDEVLKGFIDPIKFPPPSRDPALVALR